jgi:DNA-binding response OmpR family regulator
MYASGSTGWHAATPVVPAPPTTAKMHILLIEDNAELVLTLRQSLGALGIQVDASGDGRLADRLLREHAFDIVVLDLALPGLSGLELLGRLRERGDSVPVLVLTASGDTHDRVQGLNAGADDYLAKPFDLAELEARLRALHRRRLGAVHSLLHVGRLEFDTLSRRFAVGGRALDLPPREHDLLESLMAHPGRPVSKLALAQRLCSADAVLSHDALEVYVHRLRRRLEGTGAAIHTLRGLGYVLEADDDPPA